MHMIDLAPYAGALIVVLMLLCFVALLSIIDTRHVPPHVVLRTVHCARYDRRADVVFDERVQTGLTIRTVRRCPLRREGERCGEACAWELPPEFPT